MSDNDRTSLRWQKPLSQLLEVVRLLGEGADPETDLMTYEDVELHLGVSRSTVRRIVRSGRLRPRHIGGKSIRFLRRDVERLIEDS